MYYNSTVRDVSAQLLKSAAVQRWKAFQTQHPVIYGGVLVSERDKRMTWRIVHVCQKENAIKVR